MYSYQYHHKANNLIAEKILDMIFDELSKKIFKQNLDENFYDSPGVLSVWLKIEDVAFFYDVTEEEINQNKYWIYIGDFVVNGLVKFFYSENWLEGAIIYNIFVKNNQVKLMFAEFIPSDIKLDC